EPLHRQEGYALGRLALGDEAHDVRVEERDEHLPLPREAGSVRSLPLEQDLDDDGLVQGPVVSAVDRSHPARGDRLLDHEPPVQPLATLHARKYPIAQGREKPQALLRVGAAWFARRGEAARSSQRSSRAGSFPARICSRSASKTTMPQTRSTVSTSR